jgi:hypothetical protein
MENDYSGCESHNDCGGAEWPESVRITSYSASDPTNEHREPSTLQPERKYEQKGRYADFMQPRHRSEGPGMARKTIRKGIAFMTECCMSISPVKSGLHSEPLENVIQRWPVLQEILSTDML